MTKSPDTRRDPAADPHGALRPNEDGPVDRVLHDVVCEPIVERLPPRLSPHAISIANQLVLVGAVYAGWIAPSLPPGLDAAAIVVAAAAIVLSAVLDSVDGMHARRTGKVSRLGESVDHGLDAANVPLTVAAAVLALGLGPFATAAALIGPVLVYHAQIVDYHRTHVFAPPNPSGTVAQIILAGVMVVFAVMVPLVGRDATIFEVGAHAFAWITVALNVRALAPFVSRLGEDLWAHVAFGALLVIPAALHAAGLIGRIELVALVATASMRVTGAWVVHSVASVRYRGIDAIAVVSIVAVAVFGLWTSPAAARLAAWAAAALMGASAGVMIVRRTPRG